MYGLPDIGFICIFVYFTPIRMPFFVERYEKICQLYHYFTSDESIEQYMQILGVRKGRKLLGRVLPLFNKVRQWWFMCVCFVTVFVTSMWQASSV